MVTDTFIHAERRIHYVDVGHGPVVLLLHGHCCTHADWQYQLTQLPPDLRMVAPDLPYYGNSDAGPLPHDHSWSAAAMWSLLDSLGVERAILVGHSAGAMVVLEMLAQQQHRVPGFVIVDAGPACHLISADEIAESPASPALLALRRRNGQRLAEIGFPWAYPSDEDLQCLEAYLAQREIYTHKFGCEAPTVCDPTTSKWCDLPALVVAAGAGIIGQDEVSDEWIRQRGPSTNARLCVVRDSGHWVMRDAPAAFNQALLWFVAEVAI